MGARAWIGRETAAAAPARPLCLLLADRPAPAAILAVTGAAATLETFARPDLGSAVTLRHPVGGTVPATVAAHEPHGLRLALAGDEAAVAFALAVIACGMMTGR